MICYIMKRNLHILNRTWCYRDIGLCSKLIENNKKCNMKLKAKQIKFDIPQNIVRDAFYASGSNCDLHTSHVYKNINHLRTIC